MSIRRRILALIGVLFVLGLVTVSIITYFSLESFILGRVDDDLELAANQSYGYFVHAYLAHQKVNPSRVSNFISPLVYLEYLNKNGTVVFFRPSGPSANPDPPLKLPPNMPVSPLPSRASLVANHGHYFAPSATSFTVGSKSKSNVQYRAEAISVPSGTLVVAENLSEVNATLNRLEVIEGASAALVLAVLILSGLYVVRRGLRPLDQMANTADAISKGDLSRRVEILNGGSEIKRLEDALNAMLVQIEGAIATSTKSEEKLRRFVADASHELRTPLTSIRGYAELFRRGLSEDPERLSQAMSRIESEAIRMTRLVEDMLLLARLDAGRPLEATPIDLVTIVANVVEEVEVLTNSHPIDLEVPDRLVIQGDADRWTQIVVNILNNAIEHTPSGTRIRVELDKTADEVHLIVQDDGPGMSDSDVEHAFERFYRGEKDSSEDESETLLHDYKGTGLGLAIVKAIASAHGGDVGIESQIGIGTRITVSVPAEKLIAING
ncbi:MAG: HAMP domain-containing histidine kinase [Acidimicrobiales bacterium]|nr:HAMP domain-containing histidine kinase [Acidimicrobiales bacterium]